MGPGVINPDAIFDYDFGDPTQSYTARDAILYALGLGLGSDPLDAEDMRFLDERALELLPTFAVTLCTPGLWVTEPRLGIDLTKLVHFAQLAEFPSPMPPAGTVAGTAKVLSLTDRGEGKGAVLVLERTIRDKENGKVYCRLEQTLLLRGNGGFGGPPTPAPAADAPSGEPTCAARFQTSPRAALIYRLSGDWNPLHLDPAIAARAGFPRPILHGLASYGSAGLAVSRALGRDAAAVSMLACRFTGIVFPGDEILFNIWDEDPQSARFTGMAGDRKVLDGGKIEWRVK